MRNLIFNIDLTFTCKNRFDDVIRENFINNYHLIYLTYKVIQFSPNLRLESSYTNSHGISIPCNSQHSLVWSIYQ